MRSKLALGLMMAGLVLVLVACGGAAPTTVPPSEPVDTTVTLSEFSIFATQTFQVGTPYRFVITNNGTLAHEFILEAAGAVDEPLVDADGRVAEVKEEDLPAGTSDTFEWTFTEAGNFQIACHVVGHYEAGMLLPIVVQ